MTSLDIEHLLRVADATPLEDRQRYADACREYTEHVTPEHLVGNYVGHMVAADSIVSPILDNVLPKPAKVLDFACGPGRMSVLLVTRGHAVTGVDVSRSALCFAAMRAPHAVFVSVTGDGSLPFPPASFDAVVSTIALQHIQYFPVRHTYFRNFLRVLREGGKLLVQLNPDDSGRHIRWFDTGEPSLYLSPDVVCDEAEITAYLGAVGFQSVTTWRTAAEPTAVNWEDGLTSRPDAWLWAEARRG